MNPWDWAGLIAAAVVLAIVLTAAASFGVAVAIGRWLRRNPPQPRK